MSKTNSFLRVVAACGLLALTSCANLDDQQEKMLSGGAIGAVVGTVGVAVTGGCIPCGTVIGAVVGVAGGYIVDQLDKNTKADSSSGSSSPVSSNAYQPNSTPPNSYQSSSYQSNAAPSNSSSSTPYTNN